MALLTRLEKVAYKPGDDRAFDRASIARVLPNLVGIDQESEYRLCRRLAEHLLGRVPEPPAIED